LLPVGSRDVTCSMVGQFTGLRADSGL